MEVAMAIDAVIVLAAAGLTRGCHQHVVLGAVYDA
jgi:hypothetical protein